MIAGISGQGKTVGIVGGLGPETSCKFCLNVNNKFRKITNNQPSLLLENVPVPAHVEKEIFSGKANKEMLELLTISVNRLNSAGADFIAIPCNSVHVFMDHLRAVSNVPVISIIEETAKVCKQKGFNRVGLLGTTITVKAGLHQRELSGMGIETVFPTTKNQKMLDKIILRIISGTTRNYDNACIRRISKRLGREGAEAIILGCTDLQLLVNGTDSEIPLIDTLSILEDSTLRILMEEKIGGR